MNPVLLMRAWRATRENGSRGQRGQIEGVKQNVVRSARDIRALI